MNNTMNSNGRTIVQSIGYFYSSTLIISNANFNDSGMYYCQAMSSEFPYLNVTSTTAIITVVGKLVIDSTLCILITNMHKL